MSKPKTRRLKVGKKGEGGAALRSNLITPETKRRRRATGKKSSKVGRFIRGHDKSGNWV